MKDEYNYRSLNAIYRANKSLAKHVRTTILGTHGSISTNRKDPLSSVLGYIKRAKKLSPPGRSEFGNRQREAERFEREREDLIEKLWKTYSWLAGLAGKDILSDGGERRMTPLIGDISSEDLPSNRPESVLSHHIVRTNSYCPPNGTYFRGGYKSKHYNVLPTCVTYVSKPSSLLVDNMWTTEDSINGCMRFTPKGRWSEAPSLKYPNEVRDRAKSMGVKYIHRGKAAPVGGVSNGFAWTTQAEGYGIKMWGGRAMLYYNHINPIKGGWTKWVKDSPRPVAFYGSPGSAYYEYSHKTVGTPGCNCNTEGMPGWNAVNNIEE